MEWGRHPFRGTSICYSAGMEGRSREVCITALVVLAAAVIVLVSAASMPVPAQPGGFDDVAGDAYFAPAIEELAALGVFEGTLCESGFCPDESVDRKTMAVWVVRIRDRRDPGPLTESSFADVSPDSFYAPFIDRMALLGVTTGCGDGTRFCPDRPVTRAQMAVFLSRAYSLPEGSDPEFDDVTDGAWYADAVARLAASEITAGCGDGTRFCPESQTTRGQMAVFLHRAEGLGVAAPTFVDVSVGRDHLCALAVDGTIQCWGSNYFGKSSPPEGTFISVSVWEHQSCGIRSDRTIVCWGFHHPGRLLPGQTPELKGSGTEPPAGHFTMVSARRFGSCGLRIDQTIHCWGPGRFRSRPTPPGAFIAVEGQCGIQTDGVLQCWFFDDDSPDPKTPPGTYSSLSTGSSTSCGIGTDGAITCWQGWNMYNFEIMETPAGRYTAVSVGGSYRSYACALGTDKSITCWSLVDGYLPPIVLADIQALTTPPAGSYEKISAGETYACGINTDQALVCWGHNPFGPSDLQGEPFNPATYPTEYTAVSVGSRHACGLRTDKVIVCWGSMSYIYDAPDHPGGDESPNSPSGDYIAVASHEYIACGVRTDGTTECWGDEADSRTAWNPIEPRYRGRNPAHRFTTIDAGGESSSIEFWGQIEAHFCGLRVDKQIACWGIDNAGEASPPPGKFDSVATSFQHSCGLREDQTIECWGGNAAVQGVPEGRFLSVNVDDGYPCGLRTDYTVSCWGGDYPPYHYVRLSAPGGTSLLPVGEFTQIAGRCGLRRDRTIDCWGYHQREIHPPDGQFTAIASSGASPRGSDTKCALRVDGAILCWGSDAIFLPEPPAPGGRVWTGNDCQDYDASFYTVLSTDVSDRDCYVSVRYSRSSLRKSYARPGRCLIEVENYAYDISRGRTDYEYPGEGDIYELCGQDATARFREDKVHRPPLKYLAGSLRG